MTASHGFYRRGGGFHLTLAESSFGSIDIAADAGLLHVVEFSRVHFGQESRRRYGRGPAAEHRDGVCDSNEKGGRLKDEKLPT